MGRRLFRVHLSTAIVLMFASGGLIGLNLRTRIELIEGEIPSLTAVVEHGFPATAVSRDCTVYPYDRKVGMDPEAVGRALSEHLEGEFDVAYVPGLGFNLQFKSRPRGIHAIGLISDVIFAALLLVLIAMILEWNIRRRTRQTP